MVPFFSIYAHAWRHAFYLVSNVWIWMGRSRFVFCTLRISDYRYFGRFKIEVTLLPYFLRTQNTSYFPALLYFSRCYIFHSSTLYGRCERPTLVKDLLLDLYKQSLFCIKRKRDL